MGSDLIQCEPGFTPGPSSSSRDTIPALVKIIIHLNICSRYVLHRKLLKLLRFRKPGLKQKGCGALEPAVSDCQLLEATVSHCFFVGHPGPLFGLLLQSFFSNSIATDILMINWAYPRLVDEACLHVRDKLNNGRESRVGLLHSCLAIYKLEQLPWLQQVATVSYCQPLLVTGSYWQLLGATISHCQPLLATVSYSQLLLATLNNWQLLVATVSYCQLLLVTVSYCQSLLATAIKLQPLLDLNVGH